jgi:hypothetical protein
VAKYSKAIFTCMMLVSEKLTNFKGSYSAHLLATWDDKLDPVDYLEGALRFCFYKLCVKIIDFGSRSTWTPGPSVSSLWVQICDVPPLKTRVFCNFCFIKYSQEARLKLQNQPGPCLKPPYPKLG